MLLSHNSKCLLNESQALGILAVDAGFVRNANVVESVRPIAVGAIILLSMSCFNSTGLEFGEDLGLVFDDVVEQISIGNKLATHK